MPPAPTPGAFQTLLACFPNGPGSPLPPPGCLPRGCHPAFQDSAGFHSYGPSCLQTAGVPHGSSALPTFRGTPASGAPQPAALHILKSCRQPRRRTPKPTENGVSSPKDGSGHFPAVAEGAQIRTRLVQGLALPTGGHRIHAFIKHPRSPRSGRPRTPSPRADSQGRGPQELTGCHGCAEMTAARQAEDPGGSSWPRRRASRETFPPPALDEGPGLIDMSGLGVQGSWPCSRGPRTAMWPGVQHPDPSTPCAPHLAPRATAAEGRVQGLPGPPEGKRRKGGRWLSDYPGLVAGIRSAFSQDTCTDVTGLFAKAGLRETWTMNEFDFTEEPKTATILNAPRCLPLRRCRPGWNHPLPGRLVTAERPGCLPRRWRTCPTPASSFMIHPLPESRASSLTPRGSSSFLQPMTPTTPTTLLSRVRGISRKPVSPRGKPFSTVPATGPTAPPVALAVTTWGKNSNLLAKFEPTADPRKPRSPPAHPAHGALAHCFQPGPGDPERRLLWGSYPWGAHGSGNRSPRLTPSEDPKRCWASAHTSSPRPRRPDRRRDCGEKTRGRRQVLQSSLYARRHPGP
ncbi:protein SPMIP7 isoform X1 [Canis aureus]